MDFARESRRVGVVPFSSDVAPRVESASQLASPRSKPVFSKTGRFLRADRMLRTRDFTRVVKSGKRRSSRSFVVATAVDAAELSAPSDGGEEKSRSGHRRLGVTVGRRVGNAVIRNRVKRCIREWFRHSRGELPAGSDIVVIARRAARGLSGAEVSAVLDQMTGVTVTRATRRPRPGLR